jgi:hypothetical protein
MVREHSVGQNVDSKDRRQSFQTPSNPLLAKRKVLAGLSIHTCKKRTTDAPLNRMHDANFAWIELL